MFGRQFGEKTYWRNRSNWHADLLILIEVREDLLNIFRDLHDYSDGFDRGYSEGHAEGYDQGFVAGVDSTCE